MCFGKYVFIGMFPPRGAIPGSSGCRRNLELYHCSKPCQRADFVILLRWRDTLYKALMLTANSRHADLDWYSIFPRSLDNDHKA